MPPTPNTTQPDLPPLRRCDDALIHAFDILGQRWNGVILGVLVHGPTGFAELSRALSTISDSMLSARLSGLVSAGIVERDVRQGPPVSVRYRLAPRGRALIPALAELTEWAQELPIIN